MYFYEKYKIRVRKGKYFILLKQIMYEIPNLGSRMEKSLKDSGETSSIFLTCMNKIFVEL